MPIFYANKDYSRGWTRCLYARFPHAVITKTDRDFDGGWIKVWYKNDKRYWKGKLKTKTMDKEAKTFKGKAIYNPSGKAGEYSYWACNFYVGCSNGCQYCYLKKGIGKAVLGGDKPTLKRCFKSPQQAIDIFFKELYDPATEAPKADIMEHGLFFTFSSDPCLPETMTLNFAVMTTCLLLQVPIKILTKCTDWINTEQGQELLNNPNASRFLAVGFTLTGHDELEPNAAPNAARIDAMASIYNMGIKTFASIEPIVDLGASFDMIRRSMEYCDLFKIGLESGKKYPKNELTEFVAAVSRLNYANPYPNSEFLRIYFKDSLLKQAGIDRESLPANCVGRDYNLFR